MPTYTETEVIGTKMCVCLRRSPAVQLMLISAVIEVCTLVGFGSCGAARCSPSDPRCVLPKSLPKFSILGTVWSLRFG